MRSVVRSATLTTVVLVLVASLTSCGDFFSDTEIVNIEVTPPSPSLVEGNTVQLSALATFDDDSTEVLSSPVWTSSNAAVVVVNEDGVATALAEGSATISATSEGITGSTTVSVLVSPLSSIEISPLDPTISFPTQTSQQFSATGSFADGLTRDISSAVTWTSSDTSIATISNTGLAAATGRSGVVTIEARSGNIAASTSLTVLGTTGGPDGGSNLEVSAIDITPSNPTLQISAQNTLQFRATGTLPDSTVRDLTDTVQWTSSNPSVASIDVTGTAIATGFSGETTITATLGQRSASTTLRVIP